MSGGVFHLEGEGIARLFRGWTEHLGGARRFTFFIIVDRTSAAHPYYYVDLYVFIYSYASRVVPSV